MTRAPTLAPSRAPSRATQAATPGGLHVVAAEHASSEVEADRYAAARGPAAAAGEQRWSFADLPVHAPAAGEALLDVRLDGPGEELQPGLRPLGTGPDLTDVRLHRGPAAADTARRAGADALTVGSDIAFAAGRFQPGSPDGRRLIAHELAHVAQGRRHAPAVVHRKKGGTAAPPATTLTGLPEADRKQIKVVTTTKVVVGGLDDKFSTKGAKTTLGLPTDTTVALDSSVDPKLLHGLSNVAAALSTTADVSPAPLPPNATTTLELPLKAYGGIDGLYRFTFHAPPAAAGTAPARRLVVEQLGAATPVPGAAEPPAPEAGRTAPPDPVADKLRTAGITHSLSGPKLEALRAAVAQVPASHLALISGMKVKTAPDDPAKPDTAGDYSPDTHTLTMYAKAFTASQSRFEGAGGATSYAARAIVHEIGHAVDLADLRKARGAREAANQAVNAAAGTFTSKAQKDAYDAAVKAAAEAKKKLLATKTRSGSTTATKAGESEPVDVIGTAAKGSAFRQAVKKDGKDISTYAEKDWQESYAEAYSLYLTSPQTLRALRPATFAHLDTTLPK